MATASGEASCWRVVHAALISELLLEASASGASLRKVLMSLFPMARSTVARSVVLSLG